MATAFLARSLAVAATALVLAGTAAASNSLVVTYWPHGKSSPATRWTFSCAPARGTHPHPGLACTDARAHVAALLPVTGACTLMPTLTSPQAALAGTWGTQRIARSYRIGCPGWNDLRLVLTGR